MYFFILPIFPFLGGPLAVFELPLERLTFVRANHDDRTMTLGGLFPRETPGQLFQTSMFMEFSSKIDRDEWVSTLNHVITDRNVRQHNEQERVRKHSSLKCKF